MRSSLYWLKYTARITLSVAAVGVVTWIDFWRLHVNSATAAFSFLLLILALAARVGLAESIAASFAGMLAYNYFFLPPIGTFTIADPQNWVALVVFLITAVTASELSSSVRRKAEEARAKQRELQRLYDFSRALMLRDPERTMETQITQQLIDLFGVDDVWFYDAATDRITSYVLPQAPATAAAMREVARTGRIRRSFQERKLIAPIGFGGRQLGSIGVAGAVMPSEVALQAVAQLIAIAIERERAQEIANRSAAERHSEQLKSTLLDALAHEFKTPLTSIKAATTSLLPRSGLDEVGRELLTVVDEEADRLTNLVSDSIELARWGSGPVLLDLQPCSAEALISTSINQLRALFEGRQVELNLDPDLPAFSADRKLSELVVRQLIGNALKYSPPSSVIRITAAAEEDHAIVSIHNTGTEIPAVEQERLFEKFYRSPQTRGRVAGTGLGLAIAREIIEAHGGRLWVESEPGIGVRFSFTLPFSKAPGSTPPMEPRKTVAAPIESRTTPPPGCALGAPRNGAGDFSTEVGRKSAPFALSQKVVVA